MQQSHFFSSETKNTSNNSYQKVLQMISKKTNFGYFVLSKRYFCLEQYFYLLHTSSVQKIYNQYIFNFGLIFSIFKFSALKSFAENFDELQPACVPSFIDDMIDEPINSLHNGLKFFLMSNLDYNYIFIIYRSCKPQ